MNKVQTTARGRLTGKPLIGFQTTTGAVRMPALKAGLAEIKPKA